MPKFAIGVDYGTNSVRALVVNIANGEEVGTSVWNYESGEHGILLDDKDVHLARQNPADYLKGFYESVREAVRSASEHCAEFSVDSVVGIGVDTTGSTPIPVDQDGTALALKSEFQGNLHAYVWLWKDHTGYAEAEEITLKAAKYGYLSKCGGTYSSEWFWSKILRCRRVAPEVFNAAFSWVECQDYIPGWLVGNQNPLTIPRGICAAGHKAMFSETWGGLPSEEFLSELDPALAALRSRLYSHTLTADQVAGHLLEVHAHAVGLPAGIPVAVGAFDAHLGAVGSGVEPGTMVKIMGTSTCDILIGGADTPDIEGVCGIVPGSVVPGYMGIEAGQSAVGDLFNWCVNHLGGSHEELTTEAELLKPGESGLVALDWNNGNRTILVDPLLSGLIVGQTLHTSKAEIYRALIEATAFGAKKIIDRIEEGGVRIDKVIVCGGIGEKSPLAMQIYADVLNRTIQLSRSAQTCALGSAIMASVAGGGHSNVGDAVAVMTGMKDQVFVPTSPSVEIYNRLFEVYSLLHDAFGIEGHYVDLSGVMKSLLQIQREVTA